MPNTSVPTARRRANVSVARAQRLTRAECMILAAIAVALIVVASSPAPRIASTDLPTRTVTVNAGDTLWGIASLHPVAGLDTARAADLIAEINGLDGVALVEGTHLVVPDSTVDAAVAMR